MKILLSLLSGAFGARARSAPHEGVPVQAQSDGMTFLTAAKAVRGPYGVQG